MEGSFQARDVRDDQGTDADYLHEKIPFFNGEDSEGESTDGSEEFQTSVAQHSLSIRQLSSSQLDTKINRTSTGLPEASLHKFAELRQRREALTVQLLRREERADSHIKDAEPSSNNKNVSDVVSICDDRDTRWTDVRKYLDVNCHLSGPVGHGIRQPKCGLEERINEAVAEGEIEKAEGLSEQLATREFGVRAASAFAAKRYADDREVEKEQRRKRAKKKLRWGFETKQRWEMKGNM